MAQELRAEIQQRVRDTFLGCSDVENHEALADAAAAGVFILSYWVNREEPDPNADVRSADVMARLYSPIGNGSSVSLEFRYHFRARSSFTEKHSNLYMVLRSASDCMPSDPARLPIPGRGGASCGRDIHDAKKKGLHGLQKLYTSEFNEKKEDDVTSFCAKPTLAAAALHLMGKKDTLSDRKMWSLLARAAGMCALGDKSGWIFGLARKKFKHQRGEKSDNEEDEDDAPSGCVIA